MKGKPRRRTNRERTEQTRGALLAAARRLFVDRGYAATSTPDIVAAAGVTRGALYHHFADKSEVFREVLETEARAVAASIEAGAVRKAPSTGRRNTVDTLLAGADAYFEAMAEPGRARLLLVEGPAVLGIDEAQRILDMAGSSELQDGLRLAVGKRLAPKAVAALATVLGAAFDRAVLDIVNGKRPKPYHEALRALLEGVTRGR